MKKNKNKIIALAISAALTITGCETAGKANSAIGSTGTGVIAGTAVGAGVGIGCDKLTGGKNKGACVAAGLATGALAGTLAAKFDEEAEKAVPAMDCASVKRRMNYKSSTPKVKLDFASQPVRVIKPGEELKLPIKMDLATPGVEGKEQEITFKFEVASLGEKNTGRTMTKPCGGYGSSTTDPFNFTLTAADKEGVYDSTLKLINAADNKDIEGNVLSFCYTVANDGIDKCGKAKPIITEPQSISKKKKK
jgi:hypothetical protein